MSRVDHAVVPPAISRVSARMTCALFSTNCRASAAPLMPAPSTTIVGTAERIFLCDDFSIRCTIVPETLKSLLVFSGTTDGTTSRGHNS